MNANLKPGDVVQTPAGRIGKVEKVFTYEGRKVAKIRHPDGSVSCCWADSLYPLAAAEQGITISEIFHADRCLREQRNFHAENGHCVSSDATKEAKPVRLDRVSISPGRIEISGPEHNIVWSRRSGRDF
jgi:hypothetical protein